MLRTRIVPAVALLVLGSGLVVLTSCGSTDTATYDDADVTFASEMVTHHEQAVAMVAMTDDRPVDARFRGLADDIRDAQQPEIDQMTGWLRSWGRPAPSPAATGGSTSSRGGDDPDDLDGDLSMGGSMAGMMTAEQMNQLAGASDDTFEKQWLQLMIEHHQGALTMARTEIADGEDANAVGLARHIVATQSKEITTMQAMLVP